MTTVTLLITYLVIANDRPLTISEATPALVWKQELTVTDVSPTIQPDPDWCYDQIIQAHPEFATYTIAIWAVDTLLE